MGGAWGWPTEVTTVTPFPPSDGVTWAMTGSQWDAASEHWTAPDESWTEIVATTFGWVDTEDPTPDPIWMDLTGGTLLASDWADAGVGTNQWNSWRLWTRTVDAGSSPPAGTLSASYGGVVGEMRVQSWQLAGTGAIVAAWERQNHHEGDLDVSILAQGMVVASGAVGLAPVALNPPTGSGAEYDPIAPSVNVWTFPEFWASPGSHRWVWLAGREAVLVGGWTLGLRLGGGQGWHVS